MNVHDEIAKVAYELYEKSGRMPGHDLEHWLEAEKIVMARHKGQKKTSSGAKKTETKKTEAKKTAGRAKKTK
ncbi:DUF2934 domain-containing protein [Dissulfurispira sp.]|uniref:DUF2934 domain-containing protein n=1 Tax=Dissulfurispira sp. TaxID=2817609 RepID=UPI002FDA47B3